MVVILLTDTTIDIHNISGPRYREKSTLQLININLIEVIIDIMAILILFQNYIPTNKIKEAPSSNPEK